MCKHNERLTVPEAADMLCIGQEQLRAWLRCKNPPPFGVYLRGEGKKQGRYLIFRSRLIAYLNAQDLIYGNYICDEKDCEK